MPGTCSFRLRSMPDWSVNRARGAADTGTVQPHRHDAVLRDLDQLQVTAVGLHRGPDQVEHPLDLATQIGRPGLFACFHRCPPHLVSTLVVPEIRHRLDDRWVPARRPPLRSVG